MLKFFRIAILFVSPALMISQSESAINSSAITINFSYGLSYPMADLNERFGRSFVVGFGTELITKKNFLFLGLDGFFQFGSNIKEDVLGPLRTANGLILGIDNQYADVFLRQRGLNLSITFGKLFALSRTTTSGIKVALSPGLFKHWIRIQDDSRSVPQLETPYVYGYDRLTGGLSLKEFIGYYYLSKDRRLNYFFGLEFLQAFTKNRRALNFNTMEKDNRKRTDLLVNFKVGLIIPFYLADSEEIIYY